MILSIVQGVKNGEYGGIYFMLGFCLLGFVAIEIILVSSFRMCTLLNNFPGLFKYLKYTCFILHL